MEEYEPLKSLIDLTTNKKNTILYFLSDKLKIKLKEYELCDGEFYLNDYVVGIKKNNLDKDFIGKIISIDDNEITIKVNQYNITIDPNIYYMFIKKNTSKKNDRQFYKSLLEKL